MSFLDLLLLVPFLITLPVVTYSLERRLRQLWAADLRRGAIMERFIEKRVQSGDYEPFLRKVFDRYENATAAETQGRLE